MTETTTTDKKWVVPFTAALVAMLCLQMSNLGFSPLLPAIQKEFNLSFSQLGLFTGVYGIFAILLSVPAGLAIKKWGEKTVLLCGTAIVIVGLLLLSQSTDFTFALVSRGV
ncbi:MAG: MFS transporter [Saprospiraceae bacterium]|nr:MFS transporter [Saprospiraceae bacterium]